MNVRCTLILGAALLGACQTSEEGQLLQDEAKTPDESPDEFRRIDEYVLSLGTSEAEPSAIVQKSPESSTPNGNYVCVTQDLEETRRFDELVAFAGNSHALYPGAIVGADSIYTGTFSPKVLPRAPLKFSASLQGVIDGTLTWTLEEPSLSSFREGMQGLLAQEIVGQPPAQISAEIVSVYSSEQLDLAVDVNASIPEKGELEASLRFADEEIQSRFVVRFTQTYFTVDVDPPSQPSAFFDESVTVEDVEEALQDEPPAYVASITYGRTILFTVASRHAASEVEAALDFAYDDKATVDGTVSLTHQEVLDESEITAFILGGSGEMASEAVFSVEQLKELIETGGTWSPESPGAAIAYKIAWLADNRPARWSTTIDYEAVDCERVLQNVRVALRSLTVEDAGIEQTLELFGTIAVIDEAGVEHMLWTADSSAPLDVSEGESYPADGEIGAATVGVTPGPGGTFSLFADLHEDDPVGNDAFGQLSHPRPYESGWRGEVAVPLAHENQRVVATFDLLPVE